jgi:hypothetical protein
MNSTRRLAIAAFLGAIVMAAVLGAASLARKREGARPVPAPEASAGPTEAASPQRVKALPPPQFVVPAEPLPVAAPAHVPSPRRKIRRALATGPEDVVVDEGRTGLRMAERQAVLIRESVPLAADAIGLNAQKKDALVKVAAEIARSRVEIQREGDRTGDYKTADEKITDLSREEFNRQRAILDREEWFRFQREVFQARKRILERLDGVKLDANAK